MDRARECSMTIKKIRLAWKYRKLLWKLRKPYKHRREIAGLALTGVALSAAFAERYRAK
jgi:hypothetical protein